MSLKAKTPDTTVRKVRKLVEEHKQIESEPLLLAIMFKPKRNPGDIFLFEVVENFGGGHIDEDRELFEVSFYGTPSFPLRKGQQLRLVLTNPQELEVASREHWPSFEEIRSAVKSRRAQTLFSDPAHSDPEAKLNG